MAAATSMRESSLWVAGVLGPDCGPGLQEAQYNGAATVSGKPSLQAVGALGPIFWCQLPGATAAAPGMTDPSLQTAGVLGPSCWLGLQAVQFSGTAAS
jgi:hypothetical protein